MERLKQLEKLMQDINIELGAFAILKKDNQPALHSNQYYVHLVTSREYLKRTIQYMKEANREILNETTNNKIH